MKMAEVGFCEVKVKDLMEKPLIRDNIKAMEEDFTSIFRNVLNQDMGDTPMEDVLAVKSDLFYAFCLGVQAGTRTDSAFRRRFVLPDEFNPHKGKVDENASNLILPK